METRCYAAARPVRTGGFSLYELLIAVAIASILAAVAVPSYQATIRMRTVESAADNFAAKLNVARSEAVKQGQPVTVSSPAAGTNWTAGWTICCAPQDPAAGAGAGAPGPIAVSNGVPPLTQFASAAAGNGFQFDATGRLSVPGFSPAPPLVFVFCSNGTGLANNSSAVLISPSGRVRVAQAGGGANAGIPMKDDGTPVASCNAP